VTRVLFICTQNRLRSPTAEHLFAGRPGYEVASAGIDAYATTPVSARLLEWADLVFVMEEGHRSDLERRFGESLKGKQVVCLDIPDMFHYMDRELVRLLEAKAGPYFKS
jgi:predicted protein tyrosine phosphatase